MRFVDIDLAELPADWQIRATQALNDLRAEIVQAETTARAAGGDPCTARRQAIKAGLEIPARQQIWRDLAPALGRLTNQKCWYSESRNPTADKNIDHFRPKGGVAEDATHDGYWWLAFSLRNFRYSSQWCNQRRVDVVNQTDGGKADCFPLLPDSFRARAEADDITQEDPELLDPTDPDDWKLLTFRPDGRATPTRQEGAVEYQRATTSIDTYHLDCKPLVDDRRSLAGSVQRLVQELETLRPRIDDRGVRAVYKSAEIRLLRSLRPDSEYSAAAMAYARAELYKLEQGHQVKREWLEDILGVMA